MEITYSKTLLQMFLPENISGFVKSFLYLIGSYSDSVERRNEIPQIGNVYKKKNLFHFQNEKSREMCFAKCTLLCTG
jgi:hypothetical protein